MSLESRHRLHARVEDNPQVSVGVMEKGVVAYAPKTADALQDWIVVVFAPDSAKFVCNRAAYSVLGACLRVSRICKVVESIVLRTNGPSLM